MVGQVVAFCLILYRRLSSRHHSIVGFLAIQIAQSGVLGIMTMCGYGFRTRAYFDVWQYSQALVFVTWVYATWSTVAMIVWHYNGGITWIRNRMVQTLLLVFSASVVIVFTQSHIRTDILGVHVWALLGQYLSAACFLSLVAMRIRLGPRFMMLLPRPYAPNAVRNCRTLAAYFLCVWIGCAVIHITRGVWIVGANILLELAEIGCYVSWMFLTQPGEIVPTAAPPSADDIARAARWDSRARQLGSIWKRKR